MSGGSVRYQPLYFNTAKTIGVRKQSSDVELFNAADALKLADLMSKLSLRPIVSKSADYTALAADQQIVVDASGGDVDITIPDSSSDEELYSTTLNYGKIYNIKKADSSSNSVTLLRIGTQTIDGYTQVALTTGGESIQIQTDGTKWYIVAQYSQSTWPMSWPHTWQ